MEKKIEGIYIDGTEREVLKPHKRRYRRGYYSGKKKKHTVKNTIISGDGYKILFVGKAHHGLTHDYKMLQIDGLINVLPGDTPIYSDSAYVGLLKDLIESTLYIPKKNGKIKKLTDEEKLMNQLISSERVHIEHVIAHLKCYKVLTDKFRQRLYGDYWSVRNNLKQTYLLICAGLQNFKQIA